MFQSSLSQQKSLFNLNFTELIVLVKKKWKKKFEYEIYRSKCMN